MDKDFLRKIAQDLKRDVKQSLKHAQSSKKESTTLIPIREARTFSFCLLKIYGSLNKVQDIIKNLDLNQSQGTPMGFFGNIIYFVWGPPDFDFNHELCMENFLNSKRIRTLRNISFISGRVNGTVGEFGSEKRLTYWCHFSDFDRLLKELTCAPPGWKKEFKDR